MGNKLLFQGKSVPNGRDHVAVVRVIRAPLLTTFTSSSPQSLEGSLLATFPLTPADLEVGRRALSLGLCPECYGRLFGRLGHGLSNGDRALSLQRTLGVTLPAPSACTLCRGLFGRLELWSGRAIRAAQAFEWSRFTCGSRWDPEILAREEMIWVEIGTSWGESARGAFNRELGKVLAHQMGAEGTTKDPEIVFLADLPAGRVEVTVLPVYLRGRYRKFDRSLPQTHWPCRKCRGRGCFACGGSGKTYPISVEELIAGPAQEAVGGAGVRFHGMGREDIDARMLGEGRPFVLEILQPRRRTIDLRALETQVNLQSNGRLEIEGLRSAEARAVLEVKEASPQKSYRVGILGTVSVAKVNEVLQVVRGQAIAQRTPTRVAHRRSDRIRERKIIEARLVEAEEGRFTLDLRTEAGTYVKEWVEGDAGRTEPNLSALLGTPLKVEYLDVLEVHDKEG